MSLSIHEAVVPVLVRALQSLAAVLEKGRLHAESEKIDPPVLIGARLYPDMFPFGRQIQIVSDNCKGLVSRLAAVEPPKYPDTETTFAELKERLEKTLKYVQSFQPSQFEGADKRAIELKFPNGSLPFKSGWDYLFAFALPNLYFHSATAYDILRHNGVKLTKQDFLGKLD
jgi:hypothetical protein